MGIIYKITNQINGHSYIGQTRYSFKDRFSRHKTDSKKEAKSHLPLYCAVKKYGGWEHFTTEIIEECDDGLLNEREIYWIDYYDTYRHGYNATVGGMGQNKVTKQIKQQMYDLWEQGATITEIRYKTGSSDKTISNALHRHFGDIEKELKRRTLQKTNQSITKPIKQYDLQGNYIATFENATEAAKAINSSNTMVITSCRHGYQAKGFFFKYFDDNTPIDNTRLKWHPVAQYDLNGNLLNVYKNNSQAGKAINRDATGIWDCIRGRQKTCGGYVWKRYEPIAKES